MKREAKNTGGRPKSFDREAMLDAAFGVFLEKGYEGVSFDDLTKAMGIIRPSYYSTFGNNHGLFLAAIGRYVMVQGRAQSAPLRDEPDVRQAVSGYYREIIRTVCFANGPCGCLVACAACEVAERDPVIKEKTAAHLERWEEFLVSRWQNSSHANSRPSGAMIVAAGISLVQRARLGATPEKLPAIVDRFVEHLVPNKPHSE